MAYSNTGNFRPQSCICSVEYFANDTKEPSAIGTGALYEIEDIEGHGRPRTLFITSFHVAPINDSDEAINIKVVFEDASMKNITLTPSWVKRLWTSPTRCDCRSECNCNNLDVTVIELSSIAMEVLSRMNFTTLKVTFPRNKDRVKVFQYPNAVLNVGNGYIDTVHGKVFEYNVDTEAGSSGSPILNDNFQAVGIHCGAWSNQTQTREKRKGINLWSIREAFTTGRLSNANTYNDQSVTSLRRGYFRPQSCICSVEYSGNSWSESNGTGAFYEIEGDEGVPRTFFITSLNVVPLSNSSEAVNIRLYFEDETIKNIDLTPDWIKLLWTSPTCNCVGECQLKHLGITVIEISSVAMEILSRTNFTTLKVGNRPRNKEKLTVFQYSGRALNVGNGYIDGQPRKVFFYSVDTVVESSGSPILDEDFKVVGIQCGDCNNQSQNRAGKRKGISIHSIFTEFRNACNEACQFIMILLLIMKNSKFNMRND